MKKQAIIAVCLISMIGLSSSLVAKEQEEAMKTSAVLESLQSKGFNIVKEIEWKNGSFTAKVINAEGKEATIKFNPKTGDIVKAKQNQAGLSALEIAKKVEEAGYTHITKINSEMFHNKYVVKASDQRGKNVKLEVDALTGKILKK